MANEIVRFIEDSADYGTEYSNFGGGFADGFGYLGAGQPTWGNVNCALRFVNILAGNSVNNAQIVYKYGSVGSGSGHWKVRVYGIKETNTGDYSSGNPFGRTNTTNYVEFDDGGPPTMPGSKTIDVTSVVNEILGQGGWSSGNALGLLLKNNGSDSGVWAGLDSDDSHFYFRVDAEPNFTPTAKSVAAPTFPEVDSFGVKIAFPRRSAFTATEDETYMTTRKRIFKKVIEGKTTTVGGVTKLIAHGQSFIPFVIVYVKEIGSNRRYKIPRYLASSLYQDQFPDLDTTNGTVEVDATNLRITTTSNCEVYYRIFLDIVEE